VQFSLKIAQIPAMRKTNYSYETTKFKIELADAGYILVTFNEQITVTVDDVKSVSERIKWLTNGSPHCLLVDISNNPIFSENVQAYAASLDNYKEKYAEAVVVSSSWQARAANFYGKYLRKFHYVQRFFYSREKAISWLSKQKPEN
jgi:hypothetical protein